MKTTDLKIGDRITVLVDATVTYVSATSTGGIDVRDSHGRSFLVYNTQLDRVTLRNPDNWPPEAGDIWRKEDGEDMVVRFDSSMLLYFFSTKVYGYTYMRTVDKFLKENPGAVLRYRSSQD